jgi:hypothetical protein
MFSYCKRWSILYLYVQLLQALVNALFICSVIASAGQCSIYMFSYCRRWSMLYLDVQLLQALVNAIFRCSVIASAGQFYI